MAWTAKSPVAIREKIEGRVVAITGGARGIGKATAEQFLANGAAVAIGDVDVELAEKTAVELGARPGATVIGLPLDVTDRTSFETFLDQVASQLGGLDVLVNNAGIMPTGMLIDETDAMTDRMLDINLRGVITGCKIAGQRFASRRAGTIVNIASLAGMTAEAGIATYCGTKHAVVGFTEALRRELLGSGVNVTAVLPGIVRTELSAGANVPGWAEKMTTVDPEDVARTVVTAVVSDKGRLTVPTSLTATIKFMSLLPERARYAFARVTKLDHAFSDADPAQRAKYHCRIVGGDT
ncbi:MAG: SDR family NAD(P)-dependent oxidoreductase [Actinophytocola sp.]|nr:SDR family NAD(P)-dependent oxidoreductase [Actinophytocola sp.]